MNASKDYVCGFYAMRQIAVDMARGGGDDELADALARVEHDGVSAKVRDVEALLRASGFAVVVEPPWRPQVTCGRTPAHDARTCSACVALNVPRNPFEGTLCATLQTSSGYRDHRHALEAIDESRMSAEAFAHFISDLLLMVKR